MSLVEHGSAPRLDAILARAALSEPSRPAVEFAGLRWTYAEVHDRARRLAGALAPLGVLKGDRVALWAANRPEFLEVFFGVPILGAIASPLDYWWTWSDAQAALAQIRPKILIVGPAQAALIADASPDFHRLGVERVYCLDDPPTPAGAGSYRQLLASASPLEETIAVAPTDPAIILFTSGSTGRSKGAVHTHASLTASAATMCLELELADGERTLHFLPLFSSCLEHLLPFTLARATHVVMARFDPRAVWEAIRDAKITHLDAVPTTLRRLLEVAPAEIPPSLRLIGYASERMPDPLIRALIERMPRVRFVQFYGMIEHLCLTVLSPADQLRKLGTVGRPMFGAELRLMPSADDSGTGDDAGGPPGGGGSAGRGELPEGRDLPGVGESLRAGESPSGVESPRVGEVVARSPSLFAGYWEDATATAQVMQDGWMRTGDLGSFDDDGFLRLRGRIKEIIKTGGLTVIPTEIEAVLMAHPSVGDAAVVGIPDEQWGEAVHAFVMLAPGATSTEAELKTFCQERLAGYKRPKAIHLVPDLPRTGIGKIARRVVRERLLVSGIN